MRLPAFVAVFSAFLALGTVAEAHDVGATVAIALPPLPAGDGRNAQVAVQGVEAVVATDKALGKAVEEPLGKAKEALQRAWGARASGDVEHAKLLDGLALEWATTADAVLRAAQAERASLAVVQAADEAARKVDRVRALLGESQSRKERAAAELERLTAAAGDAKKGAATAEDARLAGKRVPPAPKPKAAPAGGREAEP